MKKTILTGVTAAALLGAMATASTVQADEKTKEKCYGVVKAGKNDCGSLDGSHSCAGLAKKDSDPNEWILLPAGTCERLAGGTIQSK